MEIDLGVLKLGCCCDVVPLFSCAIFSMVYQKPYPELSFVQGYFGAVETGESGYRQARITSARVTGLEQKEEGVELRQGAGATDVP